MPERNNQIDFSVVLASAVHDMKNSLCLLLQSIENLGDSLTKNSEEAEQVASIHYEAARLNTGLMQILSLYRANLHELPLNIDEHFIEDILDELLASNQNYVNHRKVTIDVNQEDELSWYLDADLVNVLLNDMLVNAMRYGRTKINVDVFEEDGFLVLRIEDDGIGYPESMIKSNDVRMQDFHISTGRTGLGLFFARMIAEAHTSDDKKGSIHLANGGTLGGGVFTMKLP